MKILSNKSGFLFFIYIFLCLAARPQDSATREIILTLGYYLPADHIPYLKISAKEKVDRKFIPQKNIIVSVYAGEESEAGLLEKINTDQKGEAKVFIPASFKAKWDSAASFSFVAVSEATKIFAAATSEISVTKARMEIDTSSSEEGKSITVKVTAQKDGKWLPVKDVELKIAIKRLLGNLPIGEEESYTTDSTGMVTAEFKRDSLSGDEKGNYTLVARTEDNEMYGNLFAEKIVTWGVAPIKDDSFHHRSLWATRNKTPVWLLIMAYGIVCGVWGTMIYLLYQMWKVRKLGREAITVPGQTHLPDAE